MTQMCDACPGYATQYKRPVLILLGIVLLIVLAYLLIIVYWKGIVHGYKVRSLSNTIPHTSENFVGREDEMQELLTRVNFELTEIRIISIVGSPGFGKSTLAIQLGHKLIDEGVYVHHVNLAEFPDNNVELVLAEKLLKSSDITAKTVTFDRLLRWTRERFGYTLLILDNCDNVLRSQKDKFQNAVLQIVQTSTTIKVIMTSRETALHIEHYSWYKVHELSSKAAISLLDRKLPKMHMEISLVDKEEIAKLTGNVPLALHIVGSLLTLEDPPSPAVVIEELKSDPMAFLSPNELPVKLRINASISLSYRYLDYNLTKVAHFLALFDGSFNKGAALKIAEYQSTDSRIFKYGLRKLVDRSLLEYNGRTERYQYHRLIREFLLGKGDMLQHKINHTSFSLGFRQHFLHLLYEHAINFNLRYVDSLRFLDDERHNIYKLLRDLTNPRVVPRRLLMEIVHSVTRAIDVGFLTCRFTSHELKSLLDETVLFFDEHVIEFQKHSNDKSATDISGRQWTQKEYYQRIYTQLIITYSDILANADNEQYAINFMEARKYIVDVLFETETDSSKTPTREPNPATNPASVPVATKAKRRTFYVSLADRYLNVGQHSKMVQCQLTIIDSGKCDEDNCTYREIGYIYIYTNNYVQAAKFFELSLQYESNNNNLIITAEILVKLSSIYKVIRTWPWRSEKEENVISLLITTCKKMIEKEDQAIFYHWQIIMEVITVINKAGKNSNFLEERLFSVISKSSTELQLQPKDAVKLLDAVKQYRNHTKTVLWGSILLKPFENYTKVSAEEMLNVLEIRMSVSFARLSLWEISKGLDGLEHIFNTIQESEVLKNHAEVVDINKKICLRLIIHPKYIYPCYRASFKELIFSILDKILYTIPKKLGYIIFIVPLDLYAETKAQEESVQTQKKSKALTTSNSLEFGVQIVKDLVSTTGTNTYSILKCTWYENISPYIWLYIKLNNLVRFSINILSVCVRLWMCFSVLAMFTSFYFMICIYILEFILAPRYLAIIHNPASFQLTIYSVIVICDLLIYSIKIGARLLQNVIGFPCLIICADNFKTNMAQLRSPDYYRCQYQDYNHLLFFSSILQFIILLFVMVTSMIVFVFLCLIYVFYFILFSILF